MLIRLTLALVVLLAVPHYANAGCNLIPGTTASFNGVLGTSDRPYAAPGERVAVALRSCDAARSPGLSLDPSEFVVTVAFVAPGNATIRVLSPDVDCTALASRIAACDLDPPALACVADGVAGLRAVERDGRPELAFRFPDTDDVVGSAVDDRTLAGPVRIAVTRRIDPLPCNLVTVPCVAQSGLVACVDDFFVNDGSCGTAIPNPEFASFTALPPPNDYQRACFLDPPCNPTATELRAALDASGNVLMPVAWQGILVPEGRVPIPRLLSTAISAPPGFSIQIPGQVFLTSFTPEGKRLGPIFEPQLDAAASTTDFVRFFGSTDAPYTILRVARHHGTCSAGANAGFRCASILDCPGGACGTSCVGNPALPCTTDGECGGAAPCGALYDLAAASTAGGLYLDRAADRRCQLPPYQPCSGAGDCPGALNDCVGYSVQASTPVPLDGLTTSADLRSFVVEEAIDGVQRNGDTDLLDAVAILRDRATGTVQPLGAPDGFAVGGAPLPGCGLSGTPDGRAAVRVQDGAFTFPAVAVEDDVLAFLESEVAQNYCDENGDFDREDAILRVFKLGAGEVTAALSPPRVVDAAPRIGGRSIAVANGQVFYRRPESGAAGQTELRANVGPGGVEADVGGGSTNAGLGISGDGGLVAFSSTSSNLLGPGGDTNGSEDVFVRDLVAGTTERVSVGPGGLQANGGPGVGSGFVSISADGRYVAFASEATNLIGPGADTNGKIDAFVHDRVTDATERVSVGPAGLEADDFSIPSALSADGRFVVFRSDASNLLGPGGDTNGTSDIFVRDRQLGTTERASVASGGGQLASGVTSHLAAISADGRYVAFESGSADVLGPGGDTNGAGDVFVHDRETGATERVSVGPDGLEANGQSSQPSMSSDGRYVAFASLASNLAGAGVDTNGVKDVFVRDRLSGTTRIASLGAGGVPSDGSSVDPTLSPDGRFLGFTSDASNLLGPGVDGNGPGDVFVRDLDTGVTERVNVGLAGEEAEFGVVNGFLALSEHARAIVFVSNATNLVGVGNDTNGIRDVFVRALDGADPLGADTLFADGALDDTVLEVLDATTGVPTTLCPAADVAVASNGTAVFLRPESAAGTVGCPGGPLNAPDADTADQVVQLWEGGGAVVNLGRAATAVAISTSGLAALVSECATDGVELDGCPDGGTDLNGDGDAGDDVIQLNVVPGATLASWVSTGQAGEALAVSGTAVAFLTSEAAQGGQLLNADGDAADRVLQVHSLAGAPLACTPTGPGAPSCVAGVRVAAETFVTGAPAVTDCGVRQLVAFSSNEAAENATNLNGGVGTPPDTDTNDDVLQVYDVVSGALKNVRQAVTPCTLAACDPRTPFKVDGSKVTFLTLEAEQGGQDLSVEGFPGDLVIQVYDFCTDSVTVIGRVDPGGQNPLDVEDDTRVFLAPAGRCAIDLVTCSVDADCGEGAFCDLDTCDPSTDTCRRYTGAACSVDADCRRCILRQPATCRPEATTPPDCPSGTTCVDTVVVAVTVPDDGDDDGVPDDQDDCPTVFDPAQADGDGDGIGDLCDAQTCGDGALQLAEECDDANTASGYGCSADCLRECEPAPLAGCRLPTVGGKASLQLKDKSPDTKDQLSWKWARGAITPKADFGQPTTTDRYELCIYDGTGLVVTATAPPGGFCAKGKVCWREKKPGFDYKDGDLTPNGVSQLILREGLVPGKAKIQLKGKGDHLNMPANLAVLTSPVRAQLVNRATGTCWESVFSAPFKKQDAGTFADKAD